MAELPDTDDPPSRSPSGSIFSRQGSWKGTFWSAVYSLKTKISSKSLELDHSREAWIMGVCYSPSSHVEKEKKNLREKDLLQKHIVDFFAHCYSVIWMTYRKSFSAIDGTSITTDCGWGCMIRSGQMILANALNIHILGKGWRLQNCNEEQKALHKKILSWFRDENKGENPFSLHSLMDIARSHGNQPGQWFGPAQVALMLREAVATARRKYDELSNFTVHLATDCTVYKEDIMDLYSSQENGHLNDLGILLLMPVRLGVERLNPIYVNNVTFLLSLDQSVGVIGGKPKHSLYFIGFQGRDLIYLDPHYPQPAVDTSSSDIFESYHCDSPQKVPVAKIDPSCAFGVYCRNQEDFHDFCLKAEKGKSPEKQKIPFPFFTFVEGRRENLHRMSTTKHPSLQLPSNPSRSLLESISEENGQEVDGSQLLCSGKGADYDHITDSQDGFLVISTNPPVDL